MSNNDTSAINGISRRTIVTGSAWSIPIITMTTTAPAFAASNCVCRKISGSEFAAGKWRAEEKSNSTSGSAGTSSDWYRNTTDYQLEAPPAFWTSGNWSNSSSDSGAAYSGSSYGSVRTSTFAGSYADLFGCEDAGPAFVSTSLFANSGVPTDEFGRPFPQSNGVFRHPSQSPSDKARASRLELWFTTSTGPISSPNASDRVLRFSSRPGRGTTAFAPYTAEAEWFGLVDDTRWNDASIGSILPGQHFALTVQITAAGGGAPGSDGLYVDRVGNEIPIGSAVGSGGHYKYPNDDLGFSLSTNCTPPARGGADMRALTATRTSPDPYFVSTY